MNDKIKSQIALLPNKPGVYKMFDSSGTIIYIGKAKNLKNRVSQYFLRPQSGKVAKMVFNVDHFDIILTNNEKESLILEMNLIQTYYPRYNILLKDDKHYPYIALKKKNDPLIKISRNDKDKNYFYFGPFPTSSYAYEVIDLLNKVFPLRKCRVIPDTACLYYHLGQCLAPCINKIDEATYEKLFNNIKDFLNGKNEDIKKSLKDKMLEASEKQDYETANEIKNTLNAINHISDKQNVENFDHVDRDVFAYASRDSYISLAVISYRNGILLGKETFIVEEFGDIEEQVSDLIVQYYQTHSLPSEVVANIGTLKESFEGIYDTNITSATRGKLYDLIFIASQNAKQGLDSHFMSARLSDDALSNLESLGTLLHIKTPYYIELFDNSHIQGDSPVGAMVAFINGEPSKKMYRKYHIEHDEKRDDFASMKEITYRRYKRLKEEGLRFPDLILVDGGLPQIHATSESLTEAGVNIPLFGLYKNDKHQTRGLMSQNGETFELDNKSSLFFMLMRMQDEVHRFAIDFHHSVRNKSYKASIFDGIKGLGKARIEIIKRNYSSLDDLKNATIEELMQFLPSEVAKALFEKIH